MSKSVDMEQAFTMMTEEDTPEVGPNDIVIHLVNPYKCGMCELEFLDKTVFKEHIFSHLEQIKQERPSSQIVMNIVLPPETPGGVTVTRDILQLGEDGSIKQVHQPANNITLNQVHPLKELEAAGVIKLEPPHPVQPAAIAPTISTLATQNPTPQAVTLPSKDTHTNSGEGSLEGTVTTLEQTHNPIGTPVKAFIKEEDSVETDVSEIIENTDGTFSVAFKGPDNEMQHIQIIRPEGMKGEMMLELTNVHSRRRTSKGSSKSNECDICGKVLSSSTNLLRHKMYHSSERPFVCNTCGKGFKDVSNLKKHIMIHNRIFPCHLCKKSFLRKSQLAMHLKRHQARTVFVKCGNSAKEVTLRTYVDDDGTRVEEMSMAALSGQVFEYKKRIIKADPADIKPVIPNDNEAGESASDVSAAASVLEGLSGAGDYSEQKTNEESVLDQGLSSKGDSQPAAPGEAVDDLPDFPVPEPPKDFVKMYQCGHCGKRTVQRGNMMRHLIHHLNDKPFRCDECPKQFVDKGELMKHKKTHSKPYRCNQCNGAFAHNVQLIKHQENECLGESGKLNYTALEDGQTYRCDICQIEMKRLGNMIKHVSTHGRGKRRMKALKQLSTGRSEANSSLKMYTVNETDQTFSCNYCHKVFKQKTNVLSHIQSHTSESTHPCSDCNRRFQSQAALDKHSSVHLKPFKCDRCPAVFSRKLFLESHLRRHKEKECGEETENYGVSGDQSHYFCKHCDKKLAQKFKMMNHIRSHLDKRPFECSECNKCFSGQYMLSQHRRVHAKLFTCETCGEAFSRKIFLQIHRKKHGSVNDSQKTEELVHTVTDKKSIKNDEDLFDSPDSKSFSCQICGSSFSRMVIKLNHEKKCKEETRILNRVANGTGFQCKICKRISTLKHNLMVHIRKSHSDIVKFDPTGHIYVKGQDDSSKPESFTNSSQDWTAEDVMSPPRKKSKFFSKMKGNEDLSDDELEALAAVLNNEEEEDGEGETDDRYTRTPGGYACATCRTKFVAKDALLTHLDSHVEKSENRDTNGHLVSDLPEKPSEETPLAKKDKTSLQKENKTPSRGRGRPPVASSAAKEKGQDTPSADKKETSAQIPATTPRSSNRPPRTQKIPSRFLE